MMALLGLVPRPLIFAAGALLAIAAAYWAGQYHGASVATAEAEARAAQATIRQLKERGMINDQISGLDDCALLRELDPDSVCNNLDE